MTANPNLLRYDPLRYTVIFGPVEQPIHIAVYDTLEEAQAVAYADVVDTHIIYPILTKTP